MFELPTLNSLDAIDRQQVHYATIQLNGPRFPIDTADYFNLVIHRALHEAGLTIEMLCQELRLRHVRGRGHAPEQGLLPG